MSAIHLASVSGHDRIVSLLLSDERTDVNIISSNHYTSLHYACMNNLIDTVKILSHSPKLDFNIISKDGYKPIVIAAKKRLWNIVCYLSEFQCVDINCESDIAYNPIYYICKYGGLEALYAFLRNNSFDPFSIIYKKKNPVIRAAKNNNWEVFLPLFDLMMQRRPFTNEALRTIIKYAIQHEKITILQMLFPHLSVNVTDNNIDLITTTVISDNLSIVSLVFSKIGLNDFLLDQEVSYKVLNLAIRYNSLNVFRIFVNNRFPIDIRKIKNSLVETCKYGYIEILQLLVNEAHVNLSDLEGEESLLMIASSYGSSTIVEFVLNIPDTVPLVLSNGKTILHIASMFLHHEIIRIILNSKKVDINSTDSEGNSALHYASQQPFIFGNTKEQNNQIFSIHELLSNPSIQPNIQNSIGDTPFLIAIKNDNFAIAQILSMQKSLDFSLRDISGASPIHIAARHNSIQLIELCLGLGMDINDVDFEGKTPIYHSLMRCSCLITKKRDTDQFINFLINLSGINLDHKDNNGNTPFLFAVSKASSNESDHFNALFDSQCNKYLTNTNSQNALHIAASRCDSYIISKVLSLGIDINSQDAFMNTPLHYAFKHYNREAIEIFSRCENISIDIKNNEGHSVRMLIAHHPLSELLSK